MKPKPFQIKHVNILIETCCIETPSKKLIRFIHNEVTGSLGVDFFKLNMKFDSVNSLEMIRSNIDYPGSIRSLFTNIDSYLEFIKIHSAHRSKPKFLSFHHDSLHSVIRHFKTLIVCQD